MGEAANGKDAMDQIEKLQPQIVLSDIVMPLMDGVDFTVAVHHRYPHIQMIILSGYDNFEYVKQTLMQGVVDYDKYVDYKRKLVEHDGKSYGIPFDCGTAALFYRLDILEQAGFSEADMQNLTWSRYMEIGQQVYQKTGIPMLTLDPTGLPLVRIIMQQLLMAKGYYDG